MSQQETPKLNSHQYYTDRFGWVNEQVYGTILDIGCKAGYVQRDNPERVLVGIDLDEYKNPNYTKIVQGNAEKLPFKDGEFRCVVLAETLNHVADPKKVLEEAKRVASESIIFVVSFEELWQEKNFPKKTKDDIAQSKGVTVEQLEKDDTRGKISGPREAELPHLYPQRYYTVDTVFDLLESVGLKARVELLTYSGFAFIVGLAWK